MKIAIVHNWPSQRNSELELIKRIISIANKMGHECDLIDPFGHLLTPNGSHADIKNAVDVGTYDFCLNLHYVNPNFFDTFSYAVNWNPLDYVVRNPIDGEDLSLDHIAYRTACLQSHDALLSAGSEEMDAFVQALNSAAKTQIIKSDLFLHTTSELIADIEFPKLNNFRVFYISANWERQRGFTRHKGLIELLDNSGIVDFYGIKRQFGINLWEDVRNYKGELPFDGGRSIIDISNRCGVSLVLHSKPHRKSGLASSRIFQACAAKTVVICDQNSFIDRHFGDFVLSFKYSDDQKENFKHIMEKIEWIKNHPQKALKIAQKANEIFISSFSLNVEIENLFNSHAANLKTYLESFAVTDRTASVDVIIILKGDHRNLETVYNNLQAQVRVHIRVVIFVTRDFLKEVEELVGQQQIEYKIVSLDKDTENNVLTEGQLISDYLRNHSKGEWFTVYSDNCRWKKQHLTQLVRKAVEADSASIAQSGIYVKNKIFSKKNRDFYVLSMNSIDIHPRSITEIDLANFNAAEFVTSSFLFSSTAFQNHELLSKLIHFDKGWSFFIILWYYLTTGRLPAFFPKLTTSYIRNDESWEVDVYIDSDVAATFEQSLAYAFFKYDSSYLSLRKAVDQASDTQTQFFSLDRYIRNVLKNRQALLRLYQFICTAAKRYLRISNKKYKQSW